MTKKVGVLGGMGPAATIHFMQAVMELTDANTDQEHLDLLVSQHSSIPDRTAAILAHGPNPAPAMVEQALILQNAGVDFIAVPCNTANRFMNAVRSKVKIPVLDIVQKTVERLTSIGPWQKIGLLATAGTIEARVYQDVLDQRGLTTVLPDPSLQQRVNAFIYDGVKAGKPVPGQSFMKAVQDLRDQGAQAIICGCTEISVIYRELGIKDDTIVDSLTSLARATVLHAGATLREEKPGLGAKTSTVG